MLGMKLFASQSSSFLDQLAQLQGSFFIIGFFWVIGVPYFLYIGSISTSSISKEVNDGTIMLAFTRPLKRYEFLAGKFLGIFLYGILLNLFILAVLSSMIGISWHLDNAASSSVYHVAIALFSYSILATLLIVSFGMLLSCVLRKNIIGMAALFAFIVLAFFAPPVISMKFPSYQSSFPDAAFLIGSAATKMLGHFGVELYPEAKAVLANSVGVYSITSGMDGIPGYVADPEPVRNSSFFSLIFVILLIAGLLYAASLVSIKSKEIY
jgi:ABC-type transport system involved in multi-copper enzyme maturation permease subunit